MKPNYKIAFIALFALSASCLAFDFKVSMGKKPFEDETFDFLIQKVIDARLNKQKPIGTVMSGLSLNSTVGNDSLSYEMNNFFNSKPEIFDATTKVIMVINQLNLRYIKGKTELGGAKDEIEFDIAIDYYLAGDKTCGLLYQQLFKYRQNATITKTSKAINNGFAGTILNALKDFKKQLKMDKKEKVIRRQCNADSLFQFLANRPDQVVTNQNIKDGLYFSCKDLYLNNPGAVNNYSFTDSTGLGLRPLIVKVPGYILERVYAVVKDKRIFIYLGGGNYKEAVLGDDGKLFFPDVTSATLSKGSIVGSLIVGVFGSLAPIGFIGSLAITGTQQAIQQAGTTITTSDVVIDFETASLIVRQQP